MIVSRFKPKVSSASTTIADLIKRGATVIKDSATLVELRRMQSIASVDDMGRVSWREDIAKSPTNRPTHRRRH